MNDRITLILGCCLEKMQEIPDGSVDMILCDLPYGTTACKWDTIIPFEPLWAAYRRVAKKNAAIVLTASQPFTSALVMSNVKEFKHLWVWDKGVAANFTQAKNLPLAVHEDVVVFAFGKRNPTYFPQMTPRDKPMKMGGNSGRRGTGAYDLRGRAVEAKEGNDKIYTEAYPRSIQHFSCRSDKTRGLHPTQKPVALMEYLIKTYTNPGEVVLDNTMGSGTTGVACMNTGRRFIGIERDPAYFAIARKRILGEEEEIYFE